MSDNVKKEIPKLKVKCNLTCQGIYALPKLIFIIGSKCIGCCRWAWWILKCYKVLLGFEHLHLPCSCICSRSSAIKQQEK